MRTTTTFGLLWVLITLLAATSCTTGLPNGSVAESSNAQPVNLEETTWHLLSFTGPDGPLTIPTTPPPTLLFEDGHYEFDAGCNAVVGEYHMADGLPQIERIIMHMVSCGDEPDGTAAMALEDAVANSIDSWSAYRLTGDELTIDYDGGQLVFTRVLPGQPDEMVIQIHGATVAPLGERTTLTITSADAVRLEWAAPGFDGDVIDPFREVAQIAVEPDDPARVGESVTLIVTGYDINGYTAKAIHAFEIAPARTATPPPATPLPAGLRALPVQMPPEGERMHMEALLEGELRLVDGCLRAGDEYAGQQGELIIWPPGYWAAAEDGVIVVYNTEGQAVARVGDVVSLGGGEVFQLFQSPTARESVVEQPPAECPGPYWVVGQIE